MSTQDQASTLAAMIGQSCSLRPQIGIVLGSGLAGLVDRMEVVQSWPFQELSGFAQTTATGHPGRLILGKLGEISIVVLQGRLHIYEGNGWSQVVYPIRVMHALGVKRLVLSNAAGGINPRYRVGDLMLLRDHVNCLAWGMGRTAVRQRSTGCAENTNPSVVSVYDPTWLAQARRHAQQRIWPIHCGTYAALTGPNYETRAEYRMLRMLGVDAVGMSTVPESVLAAQLGMRVFGVSVITNACTPDAISVTSGEAVLQAARAVEDRVMDLLEIAIQSQHMSNGLGNET